MMDSIQAVTFMQRKRFKEIEVLEQSHDLIGGFEAGWTGFKIERVFNPEPRERELRLPRKILLGYVIHHYPPLYLLWKRVEDGDRRMERRNA